MRLAGILVLFFLGSILFIQGTWKTIWEFYSWGVLSKLGQRAPLVEGDPRINYRIFVITAAIGATMMATAWWLKK